VRSALLDSLRRLRHTLLPLPVKYGGRFRRRLGFLQQHQRCSREELEAYQWRRLQELVDYAYHHVPFYRQRFADVGLHPKDIRSRADYRRIPILTKEELEVNHDLLKSDEFEKFSPILTRTSATTRDHVRLYRSAETELWRRALVWRHYLNIGYNFREPRARLTTRVTFTSDNREMPIDFNENELMIDPTSITLDHSRAIHRRLHEFRPKMIICQPANLTILVEYFRENRLEPFQVPIVYTLGEKLYPEYRQIITSYFGAEVFVYYANRENSAAATQLRDRRLYIQSEYCHLEFLDVDGEEIEDQQADIISTSLVNYAFPLIRYHTEDVGIKRGPDAGGELSYPVMELIGGRGKDLILTRDGLKCTYIWYYLVDNGFDRFRQVQLEQLSLDDMLFRIVPNHKFDPNRDLRILENLVAAYFQQEFKITVEVVDRIPFTRGCKIPMVISPPAVEYLRDRLAAPGD
jgi:phenylacetate-CoA ligase